MPAITVPTPPPLVTVRNVALIHAGEWDAMYGTLTVTREDMASAVAALDCPAIRRPVLKMGHTGTHGAGEPALGWIDNMAVIDNGRTLVGDYVGMPAWLADTNDDGTSVLASAYPDRSIEGEYDFRCQIGHTHPFVIQAVSLLGVDRPAVGTLPSLQDLATLYGVALSTPATGVPVAVIVHANEGGRMPNPRPTQVAVGVTTEDVRRQYYDDAPWSYWITEFHLEPLQLIVCDDNTGKHLRVPVTVTGDDTFEFGEAVEVLVRYVDAGSSAPVAAAAPERCLVFASRAESRPGKAPAASEPPQPVVEPQPEPEPVEEPPPPDAPPVPIEAPEDVPAAEPDATNNQEDDMSLSAIRARLGLGNDADEAAVLAALDAKLPTEPDAGTEPDIPAVQPALPEPVAASTKPTLPSGVVAIEASVLDDLRRKAELGAQAAERQRVGDRDREIDAAVSAGKIAPARKDHWVRAWEADPDGTKGVLASLEPGLVVPVVAAGATGTGEEPADVAGLNTSEIDDWAKQLGISAEELAR